jgi:hypothetical protein
MKKFCVAFVFALLAAVVAGAVYRNRDLIFSYDWARAHGNLQSAVSPALLASARDVAEAQYPGEACVVEGLGRDDRYFYAGLGCRKGVEGDHDLSAARFRYTGDRAFDLERATPEAYGNSVHRLFPRAAYEKLWSGLAHSEYLSAIEVRARTR